MSSRAGDGLGLVITLADSTRLGLAVRPLPDDRLLRLPTMTCSIRASDVLGLEDPEENLIP